ncbi:hypothetical protein F4804DRAFT_169452 [Jackrogersella minutella]|nr:hypothetical protein F4804DRAFT_169452 [Jackrogersella minutella]
MGYAAPLRVSPAHVRYSCSDCLVCRSYRGRSGGVCWGRGHVAGGEITGSIYIHMLRYRLYLLVAERAPSLRARAPCAPACCRSGGLLARVLTTDEASFTVRDSNLDWYYIGSLLLGSGVRRSYLKLCHNMAVSSLPRHEPGTANPYLLHIFSLPLPISSANKTVPNLLLTLPESQQVTILPQSRGITFLSTSDVDWWARTEDIYPNNI